MAETKPYELVTATEAEAGDPGDGQSYRDGSRDGDGFRDGDSAGVGGGTPRWHSSTLVGGLSLQAARRSPRRVAVHPKSKHS